jgi:hypothetical protein
MTESATWQDKMRAILVLIATVGTIAFNWFSAMGLINGVTPDVISAKYPTVVTPAGYAFSIWSVIYIGMVAFSIYQLLPANAAKFRQIRSLYIVSCVFNCAWIYFWHLEAIGLCLIVILALAVVLLLINMRIKSPGSLTESLLSNAPFGVYFGWVTCAAIVSIFVYLVYVEANISVQIVLFLASLSIFAASGCAILIRWKLANYLYPLAVAWALTAIAVKQSGNTAVVVSAALGTVICLVTAGSIVTKLRDSSNEIR